MIDWNKLTSDFVLAVIGSGLGFAFCYYFVGWTFRISDLPFFAIQIGFTTWFLYTYVNRNPIRIEKD